MRKDFEAPATTEPMLKSLLTSISDLQKQVASLSEQSGRTDQPHPVPPPIPIAQHPPPPPHLPTPSQLEDIFLAALSMQSTGASLQLVAEHTALFDYILPPSSIVQSPLSQAVLLTLLHRVRSLYAFGLILTRAARPSAERAHPRRPHVHPHRLLGKTHRYAPRSIRLGDRDVPPARNCSRPRSAWNGATESGDDIRAGPYGGGTFERD